MSEPFFKAENIVKKYAAHTALDDVSIEVPAQSIFGLLGPNGAGKTSLIRIINQITAPDSGVAYFNGERLNRKHIEQIGYLPEERGLYKKMKVGEQALYLARLKGMSKKEAKESLDFWFKKFDISAWWDKKVEELSKGMAQKIQFITTVMHKPKLLILDEPFSGFDPINTNLVKSEILKLREEGTTIILSTHNMGSVEEICDNIALINKSKKVLGGKLSEVKAQFTQEEFNIEFKGNVVAFANAVWGGWELINRDQIGENHFLATVKLMEGNSLNNYLKSLLDHVEIIGVNKRIPSMNEIFIKAVEQNTGQIIDKSELESSLTDNSNE
ncbi:MAG: ABC transporter ATP-binding protein [Flavobacteriales bacterium]|nr:ABC transporter ATP-binding protein [Flavobacteriales bacterium]